MTEFGDSVYEGGIEDAEDMDPAENLTGDGTLQSLDEPEQTRWDPPDHEPKSTRYGTTLAEQREGESLDQRAKEELVFLRKLARRSRAHHRDGAHDRSDRS